MTWLDKLSPLVRTSGRPKWTKRVFLIPTRRKQKLARKGKNVASALDSEDADIDLSPYRESMHKTIDSMRRDLSTIRTSGAHPGILDNVKVEAYGAMTALQKVAQVSIRDPRSLFVTVFDTALTTSVERAIRNAGLNLNPSQEANARITVPVPRMTRETREIMRKLVLKEAEGARVAARQVRRSAMDAIKKRKSEMSTDDFKRLEKEIQKFTDEGIDKIDKAADEKVRAIGGD